jgi:iron complex transport system substrate-binding protein
MKKIVLLLLAMVLGCTGEPPAAPEASHVPRRIVSLAPAITEILYSIGAGNRVVGVTNYCNYPKEASELPKIGDFAVVDFEKIVALEPDLVIATKDGNPRETVEKIQSLKIPTLVIDSGSFHEALEAITAIGKAAGRLETARSLSANLKERWNAIGEKHKKDVHPTVLLLVGVNPLVASGRGSLGDDLIRQAGGANIFADSEKSYVQTDYEAIISLEPEVILQSAMGSETNEQAQARWSEWSSIPAVRNGRVYVLDPDLINRPGPRSIEALLLIEKAIHGRKTADR